MLLYVQGTNSLAAVQTRRKGRDKATNAPRERRFSQLHTLWWREVKAKSNTESLNSSGLITIMVSGSHRSEGVSAQTDGSDA